ncbi:sensor histidine kinase [Psychromicrobium lacuslunae]|uniref:histidine kinase n=1 Tax=Psychromicrobium lacuslunae TaxID=1618207 RepID=A0A0D4C1B9_9MICC|nr:HAMP domain-containing sensor histidine kinase [Psychromicrobium lacuslunae]AJT42136.1 hypothetical protein UM93_12610 [Psychromicrobium lacuslunae]
MKLRWKLLLTIAGTVLFALLLSGLLIRALVSSSENDRMRSSILNQLNDAQAIMVSSGIRSLGATIDSPDLPADLASQAKAGYTAIYWPEGASEIWAAKPIVLGSYQAVIAVRSDVSASVTIVQNVDRALWIGGVASVLAASAIAVFTSSRLSRRLVSGAAAAERISDGHATEVLGEISQGKDEVARFAGAVDRMAAELRQKAEDEQRFSADLAHELRTPLTGLVAAAALLEDSRPAQMVKERTARLRRLVEELLEISRLDGAQHEIIREPASIRILLDDVSAELAAADLAQSITVLFAADAEEMILDTDERRLSRVLLNLLRNAAEHGQPPIQLTVSRDELAIRDHGLGYPQSIIDNGPSRFKSEGGWGLGLLIAIRQAEVLGYRLSFENATDGGAIATLSWAKTETH